MAKAQNETSNVQIAEPATFDRDQDTISLDDLARAVLDRSLRPRAAAIRRLAEGVLSRATTPKSVTSKKPKKDKSGASAEKDGKKGDGKKRKLAKALALKG